jgi:hypothetical protein
MYPPPLDVDQFRLPLEAQRLNPCERVPRHQPGEKFLKGPIPLAWLIAAMRGGKSALEVGLALWFAAGVAKGRTVTLSATLLRNFGVPRTSGYRGLAALESVGLVTVQRCPGRQPRATLLEAPPHMMGASP